MLIGLVLLGSLGLTGIVTAQETAQRSVKNQELLAKGEKKMKRMKIRGTVESINGREAVIRTSKGKMVRVMIGPESYWTYRGYHLVPGQVVSVNGWYPEESTDWFYAGTIAGSGFSFSLTNSSGMPYWVEVDEQHRMAPSYVIYRDWYGPQYIYRAPPQHDEGKSDNRGHEQKKPRGGRGR
jgi:hypothetical protein